MKKSEIQFRERITLVLRESPESSADEIMSLYNRTYHPWSQIRYLGFFFGKWLGSFYPPLLAMEKEKTVDSKFIPGEYPRKRVYWLRS